MAIFKSGRKTLNFSDSNNLRQAAAQQEAQAMKGVASINDQLQAQENAKIKQNEALLNRMIQSQQFNRAQSLRESNAEYDQGAPQRAIDAAEFERTREKNQNIANTQLIADAQAEQPYSMAAESLADITNDRAFQSIFNNSTAETSRPDGTGSFTGTDRKNLAKQGSILNSIIQGNKDRPDLNGTSPVKLEQDIRAAGAAEGLNSDVIDGLVVDGLRPFKTLNKETAQILLDRDKAKDKALSDIYTSFTGRSGSSRKTGNSNDTNRLNNDKAVAEFYDSYDISESSNWVTKLVDKLDLNNTDVTKENLRPLLQFMSMAGVRGAAALQVLQGTGMIVDGEYKDGWLNDHVNANEALADNEKVASLIAAGKLIQNDSSSNLPNLSSVLKQYKQSNAESDANFNNILGNMTPQQKTLAERRQTNMAVLRDLTGTEFTPDPEYGDVPEGFSVGNYMKDINYGVIDTDASNTEGTGVNTTGTNTVSKIVNVPEEEYRFGRLVNGKEIQDAETDAISTNTVIATNSEQPTTPIFSRGTNPRYSTNSNGSPSSLTNAVSKRGLQSNSVGTKDTPVGRTTNNTPEANENKKRLWQSVVDQKATDRANKVNSDKIEQDQSDIDQQKKEKENLSIINNFMRNGGNNQMKELSAVEDADIDKLIAQQNAQQNAPSVNQEKIKNIDNQIAKIENLQSATTNQLPINKQVEAMNLRIKKVNLLDISSEEKSKLVAEYQKIITKIKKGI